MLAYCPYTWQKESYLKFNKTIALFSHLLKSQLSSTSLESEVSVLVLKTPSAYFRAPFEAHRKSSSTSFLLPWRKYGQPTTHTADTAESSCSRVSTEGKIIYQRNFHSLKESLVFWIAGQALENTALVSTHKIGIKLLQMAFILTGQEWSANPTHLRHMRTNLSG